MQAPRSQPIHPIPAQRAFGADPDHPAVPGFITSVDGTAVVAALVTDEQVTLTMDDPAFAAALSRPDLCRDAEKRPLVLVNRHYHLVGIAFGPATPPRHLAVNYGVQRLENGDVMEIPGADDQPGWLVFRCRPVSHL